MTLTGAEQQRLQKRVVNDLASLESELKALEHQLGPITPDCSLGDLLRSEMMLGQEVLHSAYIEAKKRYSRLLYAREHLEDDTYGICADCDERIALERLLLMPEARYCIRCAKENEL